MANKLIISESQYQRLLQILNETPFDVMVDNSMEIGDKIIVTHRDGKNRFRVVKLDPNGVIMTSEDKDKVSQQYKYFMNSNSMNGSTLEFRRVNMRTEPEKENDISQWETAHYEGVSNVEIIRDNNKLVDGLKRTYTPNGPEGDEQGDQQSDQQSDQQGDQQGNEPEAEPEAPLDERFVNDTIDKLRVGNRMELSFNSDEIFLCCLERHGTMFELNLENTFKNSLPQLKDYDYFLLELIDFQNIRLANEDVISPNNNNTFNLTLKGMNRGENGVTKIIIPNVHKYFLENKCEEISDDDNADTNDIEDEEGQSIEELGYDPDSIYNNIINDKEMQQAFFSQPTFWQSFLATLRGEKPANRGIITALDYMGKYTKEKLDKKIGAGFADTGNKPVDFNPYDNYTLTYYLSGSKTPKTFTLYRDSAKLKTGRIRNFLVDVEDGLAITYDIGQLDTDGKTKLLLYMIVEGKTNSDDTKRCKLLINPDGKTPRGKNLGEYPEDAFITFYESEGYIPNEQDNEPETT